MKILLVHSEEDKNDSHWFRLFLENMDTQVDDLTITDKIDGAIVKSFVNSFNSPVSMFEGSCQILPIKAEITSHVVIFSSLSRAWLNFFLGFSCGSPVPIVIYGKKAIIDIPDEFASCFTVMETEESLKHYFNEEYKVFEKHAAIMEIGKARDYLLRMGIPVTDDAFTDCVSRGKLDEAAMFITAGFSPDAKDAAGVPMLNIASRKGQQAMVQFLIQSGAHLNQLAEDRNSSALIDGALGKHKDLVKDLVKAGADLNIQSKDGQTALIVAIGTGSEEIIGALLEAGADPDITDKLGMSARKYAAFFSKPEIAALFNKYAP